MNTLIQKLQKKWLVRLLNHDSASDLQAFLDLFESFFRLYEGVPGSAESILSECPPSKNPEEDKLVLGIYNRKDLIGLIDIIRHYPEDRTWTIGYLLIHPDKRNQGMGHRLLKNLGEATKNCGALKLRCVVQQQNSRALAFWQESGFVVVKRVEDHQVDVVNQVDILEKIL